jgi:hypothetical protein
MKFFSFIILAFLMLVSAVNAQNLNEFNYKLGFKNSNNNFNEFKLTSKGSNSQNEINFYSDSQLKKRKTVNAYFGAGYSFMIFTNKYMSDAFPVLDTRNGNFLTNINLFFGFAIAKAVTLEFSPSILFTSNNKQVDYTLNPKYTSGSNTYQYAHTYTNGIIALPLVVNARFFPLFKQKSFARLFFIGGGAGMAWIREENDVIYNNLPNSFVIYGGDSETRIGMSASQWAPVFRIISGFTGTGGQFGFGGELSYNFIPLKQDTSQPFATKFAKDMNSVDITLRFYFSL